MYTHFAKDNNDMQFTSDFLRITKYEIIRDTFMIIERKA